MAIMARATWGCELDDVLMLHAVRASCALVGWPGRAARCRGWCLRQDHFQGGTQQIARAVADELGARRGTERPGSARIERHGSGVTVTTERGQADAGLRHRRDPAGRSRGEDEDGAHPA